MYESAQSSGIDSYLELYFRRSLLVIFHYLYIFLIDDLLLLDHPNYCHRQLQFDRTLGVSYPNKHMLIFLSLIFILEINHFVLNQFTYKDMPDLEEKQLVLYAQIANLVALILQWPESEIDIKEIAENFSKVFHKRKAKYLLHTAICA